MEPLHTAPSQSSFILLSQFQEQTPQSFETDRPVLYHHSPRCSLRISHSDLNGLPLLAPLVPESARHQQQQQQPAAQTGDGDKDSGNDNADQADGEVEESEIDIPDVDVWVTSSSLLLFPFPSQPPPSNPPQGLSIPYPSISLHALTSTNPPDQTPSIYCQILRPDGTADFDDHDPDGSLAFRIVPRPSSLGGATLSEAEGGVNGGAGGHDDGANGEGEGAAAAQTQFQAEAQRIYEALSQCADLHPDIPHGAGDDDDDGDYDMSDAADADDGPAYQILGAEHNGGSGGDEVALPPPMPGSGGWITAENVGEWFDEEGN